VLQICSNVSFPSRIPSTSQVSIEITVRGISSDYGDSHLTIGLVSNHEWPEDVMVWSGIVPDDDWHYSCFNLQDEITDKAMSGVYLDLVGESAYSVLGVKFHSDDVPRSTYGKNPFSIDEFSVSPTYRSVAQTSYPDVPYHLQIVQVVRTEDPAEITWELTLSADDVSCEKITDGLDLDFTIDGATLQNLQSAEVYQVQRHSDSLAGYLVLRFGTDQGEQIKISPYASADEIQNSLDELFPGAMKVLVRTGSCQTGFGWLVQFVTRPGDQPMINASLSLSTDRDRARVEVYEVEAGGILIRPLPADYFQLVTDNPVVHLSVNDAMADCKLDTNNVSRCLFEYRSDLTPSFTASQSKISDDTAAYLITLTGLGLVSPDNEPPSVDISGFPCQTQTASDAEVVCKISRPFLAAGRHDISVTVPKTGKACNEGSFQFDYEFEITAIEPSTFDPRLAILLTLSGAGFDPVVSNNNLTVFESDCKATSVSAMWLICRLSGSGASDSTRSTESWSAQRSLLQVPSWLQVSSRWQRPVSIWTQFSPTVVEPQRPRVHAVLPSKGSVGGGGIITISGQHFLSAEAPDVKARLGQSPCEVQTKTASQIVCIASAGAPGAVDVSVENQENGVSEVAPSFEYILDISSVTPSAVGIGGGANLTVTGDGMVAGSGEIAHGIIQIAGIETYAVSVYQASLAHEIHEIVLSAPSCYQERFCSDVEPAPQGTFRLEVAGQTTGDIPITSDGVDMQDNLNQILDCGVKVSRKTRADGVSWEITFLAFDGIPNLPTIIPDQVTGGATIVAKRLQEGSASVQGYVAISMDGNSVSVPLDATEQQVEEIVLTTFPTVQACSVLVAKNVPGRYLNYDYPMQWAIRQ
jgi:hypothetical protein